MELTASVFFFQRDLIDFTCLSVSAILNIAGLHLQGSTLPFSPLCSLFALSLSLSLPLSLSPASLSLFHNPSLSLFLSLSLSVSLYLAFLLFSSLSIFFLLSLSLSTPPFPSFFSPYQSLSLPLSLLLLPPLSPSL